MKIHELIEGVEYNRINSGYKYKLEDGKLLSARANKTGGWSISLIHYNTSRRNMPIRIPRREPASQMVFPQASKERSQVTSMRITVFPF